MKRTLSYLLLAFTLVPGILVPTILVPAAVAQKVAFETATVGGRFQILDVNESGQCQVLLNNKVLSQLDCTNALAPMLIGRFKRLGIFEEVLVYQEIPRNNGCNGGPLYFLGLRRNRPYTLSRPLKFCGGADPSLRQRGNKLNIFFPGDPEKPGSGEEIWQYINGQLIRLK